MKKRDLQKDIGVNLQKIRAERNMTREQLSEKAGISPTFLANLECGNKMMSVMTLTRLADVLCVSSDTLIYGESSNHPVKNLERMLRDQPAEMIRYFEKMAYLTIEYASQICPVAANIGDPLKEVKPDGSAE